MTDLGRLSTEYQRASQAASVIDRAVDELDASPVGELHHDGNALGRYLASVAGLIDPRYAGEIAPEFANTVPTELVSRLGAHSDADPDFSQGLVATANDLIAGRKLEPPQLDLVRFVAKVATEGAVQLSRELLAY